MPICQNTRRWPRYAVDLPVSIVGLNGILTTPVPARGTKISRAGMALHAAIALKPGDLMQLQLPTSVPARVRAVVRNRIGDCLGLEFLTQLPPDDGVQDCSVAPLAPASDSSPQLRKPDSCSPQDLHAALRRKQGQLRQVQREIEALNLAVLLLADDENELSDCLGRIVRNRMQEPAGKGPMRQRRDTNPARPTG